MRPVSELTQRRAARPTRLGWIILLGLCLVLTACAPPARRAYLSGEKLMGQGKYGEAADQFRQVTLLVPTNALAWNALGLACQAAGQPVDAEKAFQRARYLNRDLAEARYNLGSLLLEQNRLDAAKGELTAFTLVRPNIPEGFLKLGTAQLRSREFAAAEKSYTDCLRLQPQDAEALNGLGMARAQRGRANEAAQCFQAALKAKPDYAPAMLNLAIVAQNSLRDRRLALEQYRAYLATKPASNVDAIQAAIRQLEQELAPPRPQTNAVVPSPAPEVAGIPVATNTTTQAGRLALTPTTHTSSPPVISRTLTSPKSEPPPTTKSGTPATKPPPAKPVASNVVVKTSTPPPAATAATPVVQERIETTQLTPEPVLKSAQDEPNPVPVIHESRASPLVSTSSVPPELSVQPKKGFFEKINPLNLLHSEKKPQNTTPVAPAAVQVASTEKPTPQPSSVPVSMKRYAYKSPAKPTSGDRSAANPLFAQGREDQNAKRYQDAIRAYQAALEKDPAFYEAQYNLGLAHSQTGNKPAGLVAYEAALAIDGKSLDARRNFALLLSESGYPLDAAHEFGTVIAEHPKDAGAELGLANVYAQQLKQPAAARQHYLRVLELEPKHIQADSIRRWLVSNP